MVFLEAGDAQLRNQRAGIENFQPIRKKHHLHARRTAVVAVRQRVHDRLGDDRPGYLVAHRGLVRFIPHPDTRPDLAQHEVHRLVDLLENVARDHAVVGDRFLDAGAVKGRALYRSRREKRLGISRKSEDGGVLRCAVGAYVEMAQHFLQSRAGLERKAPLVPGDVEEVVHPLRIDGFQIRSGGHARIKVLRQDHPFALQVVETNALHLFPQDLKIAEPPVGKQLLDAGDEWPLRLLRPIFRASGQKGEGFHVVLKGHLKLTLGRRGLTGGGIAMALADEKKADPRSLHFTEIALFRRKRSGWHPLKRQKLEMFPEQGIAGKTLHQHRPLRRKLPLNAGEENAVFGRGVHGYLETAAWSGVILCLDP